MALADILAAIEEEAAMQIAEIERRSEQKVEALLAQADGEAAEIEAEAARSGSEALETNVIRIRHRARLEVTRALRKAREEVYQRALTEARARLAGLRDAPAYPRLLEALLGEAVSALPGARAVRVDPRDQDLTASLVGDTGLRLDAERAIETWGGVTVSTGDGRTVDNTVETRLERAEAVVRQLAERVLGAG